MPRTAFANVSALPTVCPARTQARSAVARPEVISAAMNAAQAASVSILAALAGSSSSTLAASSPSSAHADIGDPCHISIAPRRCWIRARASGSSTHANAASTSSFAFGTLPTSQAFFAAFRSCRARLDGSVLSRAARSNALAASACPPRCWALIAACSSASDASSSCSGAAAARCHARRSTSWSPPGRLAKQLDVPREDALDTDCRQELLGERFPSRELRLAEDCGKLDERERIARRDVDEALRNLGRDRRARPACEQRDGLLAIEPRRPDLRQRGAIEERGVAVT